jgi:hypothetical protein
MQSTRWPSRRRSPPDHRRASATRGPLDKHSALALSRSADKDPRGGQTRRPRPLGRVTSYSVRDATPSRSSIGFVTKRLPHRGPSCDVRNVSGDGVEEWHTPYMTGGSAKSEWRQVSMRLTRTQRRRIMRLARSKERIVDPNDLHLVAILRASFPAGSQSGRVGFAVGPGSPSASPSPGSWAESSWASLCSRPC